MSYPQPESSSVRQRLETLCRKWLKNPLNCLNTAAALDRLEREVTTLAGVGHCWVNRDMPQFGDVRNFKAYCLEVHFAFGFLAGGVQLQHAVRLLLPENNSDVDFVHRDLHGCSFNFELVCVNEADDTWSPIESGGPPAQVAEFDGDGEAQAIRTMQSKLRAKTLREGIPWKYPTPSPGNFNVLVADISPVLLGMLDYWDLMLAVHGRGVVAPIYQRRVLGLFETANEFGKAYQTEFVENAPLRERIHAVAFLKDESVWQGPLAPDYLGMLVHNPALVSPEEAGPVLELLKSGFASWVKRWLADP